MNTSPFKVHRLDPFLDTGLHRAILVYSSRPVCVDAAVPAHVLGVRVARGRCLDVVDGVRVVEEVHEAGHEGLLVRLELGEHEIERPVRAGRLFQVGYRAELLVPEVVSKHGECVAEADVARLGFLVFAVGEQPLVAEREIEPRNTLSRIVQFLLLLGLAFGLNLGVDSVHVVVRLLEEFRVACFDEFPILVHWLLP